MVIGFSPTAVFASTCMHMLQVLQVECERPGWLRLPQLQTPHHRGVDYEVAWDRILQPPVGALEVDTRVEEHVVVITLFPGGGGHRPTAAHDDLIASLRKRW